MLAKRLIAVILLRDGRAVKSKQFKDYRDVGDPVSQARLYYANGIDELIILNTQSEKGIWPLMEVLPKISKQCFIPVSAGGGIKEIGDVANLFSAGCEKVVIRTHTELIPEIAQRYGRQAVIECRDIEKITDRTIPGTNAGELLLQRIDLDGCMNGYDIDFIASAFPIIALGGCGNYQHMADAFEAGIDACAASSIYSFTDSNPFRAKAFLRNKGIQCRA